MSDFVKNIVKQVLDRGRVSTAQGPHEGSPSTLQGAGKPKNGAVTIERPNYQQLKKDRRLSPLKKAPDTVKPVQRGGERLADSLSQLQRLSLSQGVFRTGASSRSAVSAKSEETIQEAVCIGRTRDETYVWFFPQVHRELRRYFRTEGGGGTVGVISAPYCYPGQLFFVEELLRELPGAKHDVKWKPLKSSPFMCELYCDDSPRLYEALKSTYQKLNRRALQETECYTSVSPSAWLLQQLAVDRSVNAVGVLEGIPRVSSIGLLDKYFKAQNGPPVGFKVEDDYVLLFGEAEPLSQAVTALKQGLGQLLKM